MTGIYYAAIFVMCLKTLIIFGHVQSGGKSMENLASPTRNNSIRVIRSAQNEPQIEAKSTPKNSLSEDQGTISVWIVVILVIAILFVLLAIAQCILLTRNCCCHCILPSMFDECYWEEHHH